jgi:hypothetical protein
MNRRNLVMLTGIISLIVVVILLLTSPNLLFSPVTSFICTDIYRSSNNNVAVRTKTDFASQTHMTQFPLVIGKWTGVNYDTTEYIKELGGDVMLVRRYDPKTFTQPLFLTIVQAKTESSFHPPRVCFVAQGYKIQEDAEDSIMVDEASWVKGSTSISIPLRKLVVTQNSKDGGIIERRIALYFYVKGNQFYSDTITLVEVYGLVPISGSYDGTLSEGKDFISQAMPLMFEPDQNNQGQPIIITLAEWGFTGYILIFFLLLVPVSLISYPFIQHRMKTNVKQ